MKNSTRKSQQKRIKEFLRTLNSQTSRVPGYSGIILKILTLSAKDRLEALERITGLLKRYPGIKIMGLKIISMHLRGDFQTFDVRFRCSNCKKETTQNFNGLENQKELLCHYCWSAANPEPDYDHWEPDMDDEKERYEEWKNKKRQP